MVNILDHLNIIRGIFSFGKCLLDMADINVFEYSFTFATYWITDSMIFTRPPSPLCPSNPRRMCLTHGLSPRGALQTRSCSELDSWIVPMWEVFNLWIVNA